MIRSLSPGLQAWMRASVSSVALSVLGGGLFSGCDNPACVFSPDGSGSCLPTVGPPASGVSAAFPEQGEWILDGAPKVENVYPKGTANPETPIVVVFSESMTPSSVEGAFAVNEVDGLLAGSAALNGSLVGDGRVLVLFPAPLTGGASYEVVFVEGAEVRDLTGSLVLRPSDGVIGSFSVDDAPAVEPKLVTTWPEAGSIGHSDISEIVVVFDRLVDPTTVTADSWEVTLGAGSNPPTFNPLPKALADSRGGGAAQDTRVWTWKSVDTETSRRASLGANMAVRLSLSPERAPIATEKEDALVPTIVEFTTQSFSVPVSAEIISAPTDAIGIDNLTGVMPLMVEVTFVPEQVLEGDVLEISAFGTWPGSGDAGAGEGDEGTGEPGAGGDTPAPTTILALLREIPLTAGSPTVVLEPDDLLLTESTEPLVARFDDGDMSLAFHVRRGVAITPVVVLDVDSDTEGIQDPVLDTVAPLFLGLAGVAEGSTDYRSDMRDLVVIGAANEELRSVEIAATLPGGIVDNRVDGELPPLPRMTAEGVFIAAACPVGLLDPGDLPLEFAGVLYDRALNPSVTFSAEYTQFGLSGPGTALPGSGLDVLVTVYDHVTGLPVNGATVHSHESVGGILSLTPPDPLTTNHNGRARIAGAPTGQTLITVEKQGYDIFTLQGVATTRLDVILVPSLSGFGSVMAAVTGQGEGLSLTGVTPWVADSRGILPGDTAFAGEPCAFLPLVEQSSCTFDPGLPAPGIPIRAQRPGLFSFLATQAPVSLTDPSAFSPGLFLLQFALEFPRPKVVVGIPDAVALTVGPVQTGPGTPPEVIPLGTPPVFLEKSPDFALAFPDPVGHPQISVETLVFGLPGSLTVGMGLAYFDGLDDRWDVRAAYAAAAKEGGELETAGAIEADRFLRAEHVDQSGARSGARMRLSAGDDTLLPPGIPLLASPVPGDTVSGTAYDLVHDDVFGGALDGLGLYRVTLTDSNGRRWTLWRDDPPDAEGAVITHLPPIALAGGVALAHGPIRCVIEGWSWPTIDLADFLWTDVEREHDQFFSTPQVVYQQEAP